MIKMHSMGRHSLHSPNPSHSFPSARVRRAPRSTHPSPLFPQDKPTFLNLPFDTKSARTSSFICRMAVSLCTQIINAVKNDDTKRSALLTPSPLCVKAFARALRAFAPAKLPAVNFTCTRTQTHFLKNTDLYKQTHTHTHRHAYTDRHATGHTQSHTPTHIHRHTHTHTDR